MKRFLLILVIMLLTPSVGHALELSAHSACLIAADSGQVIFAKAEKERAPMASTTKMMTALLAAEYGKWDEEVTVTLNAQNQEGSRIYLAAGDKLSLYDMVCGMMLNSGNDAAMAIAEHISGSSEAFAQKMTERAAQLGAKDTQFMNPNGLDADGHYSTAFDLAVIARAVIQNDTLSEIVKSREMKVTSVNQTVTYLRNHNKLLWNYDGLTGVKTGFTKKSGRCLVTSAERGGVRLIAVTMNAPDDWSDHKKMLDYGFEVCTKKQVIAAGEELAGVFVNGSRLGFAAAQSVDADCIGGKAKKCNIVLHRIKSPEAPINKGEKLGTAEVFQNENLISEIDLVADRDIYEGEKGGGIFERLRGLIMEII